MESPTIFSISDSISFETAIEVTQSLLSQIESDQISEAELERIITALVHSENGARGFFVCYLTDEREIFDQPSSTVIKALKTSPIVVGELLVKNLAMSTAMILTHTQNQNPDQAEGSARVQRRTMQLIQQTELPEVETRLKSLKDTIQTGTGEYKTFLDRWKYNDQQRQAIDAIVTSAIS